MFDAAVCDAARAHARLEYPKESCGLVSKGQYVPLPNVALDPLEGFELPAASLVDHAPVDAVIHSHCAPRHRAEPSAEDMANQIATGIPVYGIVLTDGAELGSGPLWFGEFLLDEPLIGREFVHGVRDCYSLIRAWYWQERKVKLKEFPRGLDWWKTSDLYRDGFPQAGFRAIDADEAKPGDVLLMQVRERVPHHAAILLEDGLLLHHLPGRLSRREPAGQWRKYIVSYLRHGEG